MLSSRDKRESAPPPHTGLLRDETLVLRQLLGYSDVGSAAPRFQPKGLGDRLQQSSMRDVLFVGLDIDTYQGYDQLIADQQLHIGVSILDTRVLEDMLLNPTTANYQEAITSYQFTVGESAYCQKASKNFLFGLSQPISITELKPRLGVLLSERDYVLVLHGTHSDLKILQHLNIDLPIQSLYVIDTNKAAQSPLKLYYRYSLEKLLEAVQIPYANLHAAGNDAHYCLRALLMIAVFDAERHPSGQDEALLHLFRAVAQAPRPLTRGKFGKWKNLNAKPIEKQKVSQSPEEKPNGRLGLAEDYSKGWIVRKGRRRAQKRIRWHSLVSWTLEMNLRAPDECTSWPYRFWGWIPGARRHNHVPASLGSNLRRKPNIAARLANEKCLSRAHIPGGTATTLLTLGEKALPTRVTKKMAAFPYHYRMATGHLSTAAPTNFGHGSHKV